MAAVILCVSFLLLPALVFAVTSFVTDTIDYILKLIIEGLSALVFLTLATLGEALKLSPSDTLGSSEAIKTAWSFMRDATNFFLALIFIWYSFSYIWNGGASHFNHGKAFLKLFIAALLINFSVFFLLGYFEIVNDIAHGFIDALTSEESAFSIQKTFSRQPAF